MNRKRNYQNRKKSNKALTITLLLTSLLMTAVVVWIALNDWDVNKTLRQAGIGEPEAPTVEEPEQEEEQEQEKEQDDIGLPEEPEAPKTEPPATEEKPVEEKAC